MKNKKVVLMLSMAMALGSVSNSFAKDFSHDSVQRMYGKENKINFLKDANLIIGYENGNLELQNSIKRSEITKLLVSGNNGDSIAHSLKKIRGTYSDVAIEHWANGYINVLSNNPVESNGLFMLKGYEDNTFRPENNITYAELAKMLVVLVDQKLTEDDVKNADSNWANEWVSKAKNLGIFEDVTFADFNTITSREEAFIMFYNALNMINNVEEKTESSNEKQYKNSIKRSRKSKRRSSSSSSSSNNSNVDKDEDKKPGEKPGEKPEDKPGEKPEDKLEDNESEKLEIADAEYKKLIEEAIVKEHEDTVALEKEYHNEIIQKYNRETARDLANEVLAYKFDYDVENALKNKNLEPEKVKSLLEEYKELDEEIKCKVNNNLIDKLKELNYMYDLIEKLNKGAINKKEGIEGLRGSIQNLINLCTSKNDLNSLKKANSLLNKLNEDNMKYLNGELKFIGDRVDVYNIMDLLEVSINSFK